MKPAASEKKIMLAAAKSGLGETSALFAPAANNPLDRVVGGAPRCQHKKTSRPARRDSPKTEI
jgi:hypothetical protein